MEYTSLFSSLTIGPVQLTNRIVLSAMTTGFGFHEGAPTPQILDYFTVRSRDTGMATVAFGAVRPEGRVEQQIPWMWRDDAAEVLRPLATAIAETGSVPCLQLGHGGRQVSPKVTGEPPVAPSAVAPDVHVDVAPHPLSTAEVDDVIAAFASAATAAAAAGFRAIEIHGGHGYLIQQFLSPVSNLRTDRFGTDRTAFGGAVVSAVRDAAPEVAVVVRINGSDLTDDGLDLDDAVEAATAFVDAGAHALLVSAGVYGSVPYTIPLLDDREGCFLELAAAVRAQVRVPVIGVGRITRPATADDAIASGKVDAVAIGRALLADPGWIDKARDGRTEEIRPCIATVQGCAGMLQHGNPISCAVNPEVGREGRPETAAAEPQELVVIGAGPAGMEAARRAAELGHSVSLLERADRLGGQLRWAATTPPLAHFADLLAWYERRLDALGVDIRLESDGSAPATGAVIVATGAQADIPAFDGFERLATWTLDGYFDRDAATTGDPHPHGQVVVAGGGQRALATALRLATEVEDVMVVAGDFGRDTSGLTRRAFLARCDRSGVTRVKDRIVAIGDAGVVLEAGGEMPADGLVLVEPLRPNRSHPPGAPVIGDALTPGGIAEAIAAGRQAAEAL